MVHDFDGDGLPDIVGLNSGVYSSDDNELAVARNLGERRFSQPTVSLVPGAVQAFIARADFDIDGDARPDPIIAANDWAEGDSNMLTPLFDASGALTSAERSRVPGYCFLTSSALGDFDGDGRQDLAISGQWPSCNSNDDDTPVAIWRGGTTQPDEVDFVRGTVGSPGLVTHDVNRDGRDDLVALFGYGSVNVFYGGEEPPEEVSAREDLGLCEIAQVSGQMRQFQSGDIDGDGEPELVAAAGETYDSFNPNPCTADHLQQGVVIVDLEAGIVEDVFPELGRGQLLPLVSGGVHQWVWSDYDPGLDRTSLQLATLQR